MTRCDSAQAVMPFGKYRGRPLGQVPEGYLGWLLRECDLRPQTRAAVEAELRGRRSKPRPRPHGAAPPRAPDEDALPAAAPRVVFGVALDAVEAGLFERAVGSGVLTVTPDLPLSSPVPEAWRRHCEASGVAHVVRETTL